METKVSHHILRKLLVFLVIFVSIVFIIIIYGYTVGTSGLLVKECTVEKENILDEFYGLKIVHISDIHYGFHYGKRKLETVVNKINELNPDVVVLTGDLVDNKISKEETDELKNILSKIDATIGKYAIKGNHDYDLENWEEIIRDSDFIDLNDTYNIIYGNENNIMISGISTNLYGEKKVNEKLESSKQYLETNNINYKILLIHEPDYIDDINDISYDLVLAGHGHNGQVRLPWIGAIYTPRGSKKYYKEHYELNDTDLYISSGIGTTIMNIRLFNKPSINLYRLKTK